MPEFLAGDVHEITAKLAYQFWEQRGRPFGSPELDWLLPKRLWGRHSEIRDWNCPRPCTA